MSTDTDDLGPFAGLVDATTEINQHWAMLEERMPQLAPAIAEARADLARTVEDLFRPYMDLAQGKITVDQFRAIQAEHDATEQERRRMHYGITDSEEVVELTCEDCGDRREWDCAELGEFPPIYFQCEDIDGTPCVEDDDA